MRDADCPLCGMDVPTDEAEVIERDMEYDNRSCITCGRTFWEAREEELEPDEDWD